jgi:branched-chain amino acid transport system permease protein
MSRLKEHTGTKDKTNTYLMIGLIALVYIAVFILEQTVDANKIVFAVLKKGAIYSLVAVSMNLLNGFTGLFSLGQAGFMLLGAYTYAILTMPVDVKQGDLVYKYYEAAINFDVGIFPGLIAAGLAAALFAALIGLPVLRLKSDYLAIATLGFAEIMRAVFQWDTLGPVTNGANMLREFITLNDVTIPLNRWFGILTDIKIPPTIFVFFAAGLCIGLILLLINSSYGRAFKAIRDDEIAAEAMGINLFKHKQMSFIISSFFAGVSGGLLAMFQMMAQANQFKAAMTYEILLIVVIGGIGSISGSCIASFLFVACSEWWLRFLDEATNNPPGVNILRGGFRNLVFSIVIMIIVLFFSRGIMGEKELSFKGLLDRIRKKRNKEPKEVSGDV